MAIGSGNSFNSTFLAPVADGVYWRELVFLLLRFFLGIASLVLMTVVISLPVAGVVAAVLDLFGIAEPDIRIGPLSVWSPLSPILWLAISAAVVVFGPTVVWAYAQLHGVIAHYLLGPSTATLFDRVTEAETRRDQSITAAEAERQRIERDLHDGAQARLSTVALDLGRARRKLRQGADPDEVAAVIDAAHADAKAAIVELRNLARGIHPAVLTDRGLDAALSEIIARSPTPVNLNLDLTHRPSATTESAAYFAVCELLNNVNRHSSASRAWVTGAVRGDTLLIEVGDDGVGGVEPGLGTGVSGLHHRIESLGGTLTVDSPLGDGTTATIELPMTTGLADSNGAPDTEQS